MPKTKETVTPETNEEELEGFETGDVELGGEKETPKVDQKEEDVLDTLVPKAKSVEWTIGQDQYERKYVQRPLSFIAKMQWFALVGEVLQKSLGGEDGLSLTGLLAAPDTRGVLSMSDFADADTFVQAIAKLMTAAPDFLIKSYCIWLNVPEYERELVANIMALPEDEGGLSDAMGMEIIDTFLDQNYEALDTFFRERLQATQKRFQARQRDRAKSL